VNFEKNLHSVELVAHSTTSPVCCAAQDLKKVHS